MSYSRLATKQIRYPTSVPSITLRRKTRITYLESPSLSGASFIPIGGLLAHDKLINPRTSWSFIMLQCLGNYLAH
jgi:hypothetical protein